MKIKKLYSSFLKKVRATAAKTTVHMGSVKETLSGHEGSAILEYVLIAIIVVVLAGALLEYNTGLFSKTIFPKITEKSSNLFGS